MKSKVPVPVIVAAIVAVVLVIAVIGFKTFTAAGTGETDSGLGKDGKKAGAAGPVHIEGGPSSAPLTGAGGGGGQVATPNN